MDGPSDEQTAVARPREHQTRDEPPSRPRRLSQSASGSLRRRLLFIFLALATIPGYLALMLLWLGVSGIVRSGAREQTFTMSRNLAVELDRQINERVLTLTGICADPEFATETRQWVTPYLGVAMTVAPSTFDEPMKLGKLNTDGATVYLLGPRGQVLARLTPTGYTPAMERPAPIESNPVLRRASEAMPDAAFAVEILDVEGANPSLILVAPLSDPRKEGTSFMLAAHIPLTDVFRETERLNPTLGQRLLVLSEANGVVYATHRDRDLELTLNRLVPLLFGRSDDDELLRVTIRDVRYGVAASDIRTIQTLTTNPVVPAVHWRVVQAIDLEEVLSGLKKQLWTAVLAGILLTAFAGVLAVWASGRVVEPIIRLTGGMQRFAMGDLDYRVHVRTGDELEVLANAANHMASSLLRSYQDLGQRMLELDEKARQLELIHSISHSVNRVLDMDALFERLMVEIRDQVPCEILSVGLVSDGRDRLALDYVHPIDSLPRGFSYTLSGSLAGETLRDQTLAIHELEGPKGSFEEDRLYAATPMRRICVVPLLATNGAVGTLTLATANVGLFDPTAVKILERISESLALAVEHSRLYTRVARFAEELESTVEARTRELREAQAKLVQTEKFAATGSIASNIAHEINNPLSIIKNYIRILQGQFFKREAHEINPELLRKSITIIEEEIDRIARIVSQLRMVSQPARATPTRFRLDDEIHKLAELLHGSLRKQSIELELQLDPDIGEVLLCQDYLRQIVINFVRNAMDAMERGGGIITVRTRNNVPEAGRFAVEVQDTGTGIPEEHLSKIFDPFFTTKVEGKGTGLGLSVSFGLARTMGGTIEVDTRIGEGTTMRLVLPKEAPPTSTDSLEAIAKIPVEPEPGPGLPFPPGPAEETPVRRRGRKIIIG